jgi:hypothetical protein
VSPAFALNPGKVVQHKNLYVSEDRQIFWLFRISKAPITTFTIGIVKIKTVV